MPSNLHSFVHWKFTYFWWCFHTFSLNKKNHSCNVGLMLIRCKDEIVAYLASHVAGQNVFSDYCISRTIEAVSDFHTSALDPHKRGVIPPVWVQRAASSDPITAISHRAGGSLCPSGCAQGPRDAVRSLLCAGVPDGLLIDFLVLAQFVISTSSSRCALEDVLSIGLSKSCPH